MQAWGVRESSWRSQAYIPRGLFWLGEGRCVPLVGGRRAWWFVVIGWLELLESGIEAAVTVGWRLKPALI